MMKSSIAVIVLSAFFLLPFPSRSYSDETAIENRIKLMKENSADNKALKAALAKGDFASVETKAKEIVANFDKVADLFPKGSTSEKSRAKPEIWEKWDDFKAKLTSARTAAKELGDAAATKNQDKVGQAFVAFGETCGNCHKPYRAPRN